MLLSYTPTQYNYKVLFYTAAGYAQRRICFHYATLISISSSCTGESITRVLQWNHVTADGLELWPRVHSVRDIRLNSVSIDVNFALLLAKNVQQINRLFLMHIFSVLLAEFISISLIFTARKVCIARTAVARCRCPSVCLQRCCLNGYTYPQSFFHSPIAPPF